MRALSRRVLHQYFQRDQKLFLEIFGYPMSELKHDGLIAIRPWRNEWIAVAAPTDKKPLLRNTIMWSSISHADRDKSPFSLHGNVLLLNSGLQVSCSSGRARHLSEQFLLCHAAPQQFDMFLWYDALFPPHSITGMQNGKGLCTEELCALRP